MNKIMKRHIDSDCYHIDCRTCSWISFMMITKEPNRTGAGKG